MGRIFSIQEQKDSNSCIIKHSQYIYIYIIHAKDKKTQYK